MFFVDKKMGKLQIWPNLRLVVFLEVVLTKKRVFSTHDDGNIPSPGTAELTLKLLTKPGSYSHTKTVKIIDTILYFFFEVLLVE